MRVTEILLVILVSFLFFVGHPGKREHRQEQQAAIASETNTLEVVYRVQDSTQEELADINWLKKAAQAAMDEGKPYFSVLNQRVTRRYSKKEQLYLTTIEGRIEITDRPMETDYDANEILGLNLGE